MFYTIKRKKKKKIPTKFQKRATYRKKPIVSVQQCSLAVRSMQHNIISISLQYTEDKKIYLLGIYNLQGHPNPIVTFKNEDQYLQGHPNQIVIFKNEDNKIMLCWTNNALDARKVQEKKYHNGFMDFYYYQNIPYPIWYTLYSYGKS